MRKNLLSRVKNIAISSDIRGFHGIPAKYSSVLLTGKLKQVAQEYSFLERLTLKQKAVQSFET